VAREGAKLSSVTPEQFGRIERLFFEARDLPQAQWPTFLETACADDARVRDEVRALLATATRMSQKPSDPPAATVTLPGQGSDDDDAAMGMTQRLNQALRPQPNHDADIMVGKRVEDYDVVELIDRGGMGVVYKGRQSSLNRTVALKALPHIVSDHPEHLSRLRREAKVLASLSHPHIASIYDLAERDGTMLLVMEYIDGESLAKRLDRGALSIEDALTICSEIAEGVEAAHCAGVIHRDLKPGNVMIARESGVVKVLDFGLATGTEEGGPSDLTAASFSTAPGAVMGTPGYMSPEQLRGQALDKRSDVFGFGCILYECLTGDVAFSGETKADIVASVLDREPDWSKLPARTPANVRRLLARCLAKNLNQRLRDLGDARLELQDALVAREWANPPLASKAKWRLLRWLVAGATAGIAAAMVLALIPQRAVQAPAPVQRFSIAFPDDVAQTDLARVRLALSRGGNRLAVSANDRAGRALFLRERDRGEFRRIDGTDDGWIPAFSPDGSWLIYFHDGQIAKRPVNGGTSVRLSDVRGYWSSYHWAADGKISYVPYWSRGVARVSSDGGPFEFVTQPDYASGDCVHVSPVALPDGSAVLYTSWNGKTQMRIDAMNLRTKRRHTVVENATTPRLAATPRGSCILWERSGTIFAAPFDVRTLQRTGSERAIASGVMYDRVLFVATYDVADDGTLAYVPGPVFAEESRLSWLKPGDEKPTPIDDRRLAFVEPNFSADGNRLSVILKDELFQPYVFDFPSNKFERIVTAGDVESCAISPDGQAIAYSTNRNGPYEVWIKRAGDAVEEMLYSGPGDYPCAISWSPDGNAVAFSKSPDDRSARDVFVTDVATKKTTAFCNSGAEERAPRWSPDGRWLAYVSDETGQREVLLRSYPSGTRTRQASTGGGDWPVWSPAEPGKLYFRAGGKLHAVTVDLADGSVIARPPPIYAGVFGQTAFDMPDYTAHPDGRLLLIEQSERGPSVSQINVILNWHRLME